MPSLHPHLSSITSSEIAASTTAKPVIAVILPRREGFNSGSFGAISLTVRDFTEHSRHRDNCYILGAATAEGFDGLNYIPQTERKRWWQSNTSAYAEACLQELHRLRPHIIEIHNRPVMVRPLAAYSSAAVTLHLHNDPQEMKGAQQISERKYLLEHCAAIYCVSGYIRERFLDGLSRNRHRGKVHIVYNGLAIPEKPSHKQRHILFVGRLTPEKGALEFTEALAGILPEYKEWQGVIIGGKHHRSSARLSPYEKKISAIAGKFGNRIDFAGFCSYKDTMRAFADAEIAVVPSLWNEAFGRTALEAMASGCALITSGRGGLKEIAGDASALIVPEITAETLSKAISTLIRDDDLREQFQHSGYERARQFSITRCTKTLDDIRERIFTDSGS